MGKINSKSFQNDEESREDRQQLKRQVSRNYPCNFSWQQHNVDSSNLPNFIKIPKCQDEAIFGTQHQKKGLLNHQNSTISNSSLQFEEIRKISEESTTSARKCKLPKFLNHVLVEFLKNIHAYYLF